MTEKEQQFNQWFDQYANGVKVFEEADMKQAYLQGRADLEKENAELRAIAENQQSSNMERYFKNKDLEKENAKLKSDNTEWERASYKWKSVYELTNNQLTNAKEIIRKFMKYEINEYDGSLEIHFEELKKQAERFLNNEVEK